MWIEDGEYIIRCGCGDVSHPIWFYADIGHFRDTGPYYHLGIGLQIVDVGLWQRIKNAALYIFKQRKFWHYGDITLDLVNPKQREEIVGLIKFLDNAIKKAGVVRESPSVKVSDDD